MTEDPFGAAGTRERVLAAWSASPVRFREDANAEEDLALGGYRDRLLVELAANAADAAARAGVPGRLLLALRELDERAVLVAANTGASLDAAGVQALATLRASAKRDDLEAIGRFGVGFAAVLAVTDEPAVISRSGGVRFSAADTRALVEEAAAGSPGLGEELARRDGHVPVLRLPFETEGSPPQGYDTAVLLPLRDAAAEDLVLRLLEEVGDPLLLALPALAEVTVDAPGLPPRTLGAVGSRWHVVRRQGRLDPALLADRPTEERARTGWQVTWALPRDPLATEVPGVLHAPTPSDEPLPWPALLLASFPMEGTRRHVAPGPATDLLVEQAGQAYADLLAERAAAGDAVLGLLPPGLPAGVLDGALRRVLLDLLPGTPLLPSAEDPHVLLRPRDAVALDPPAGADQQVVDALSGWLAGLVLARRADLAALAALGVQRLALADVVETLPASGEPSRWRECYAALHAAAGDPLVAEALAGLPVPLVDGRVVRGARGAVMVAEGNAAASLAALGVRVVDPEAAHPLLERLGATQAGPRAALELPAVRAAVASSADAEEADAIAVAVLELVAAAASAGALRPGDLPWLADLALPDADGEPAPAGALALPGTPAAELFDPDEIGLLDGEVLHRWGAETLAAAGVLTGPSVLRLEGVPLDAEPAASADDGEQFRLDGWEGWTAACLAALPPAARTSGPIVAELVAVRDLDAVRDEAMPRLVTLIAADPGTRRALTTPARVIAGPMALDVPAYTAWWLRRHVARTGPVLDPDAAPALRCLFPPAPDWLAANDPAIRRALGAIAAIADLDVAGVSVLLDRMADPDVPLAAVTAVRLWDRLARLADSGLAVDPPSRVRVLNGSGTQVVDAGAAVVVESPMYLQRHDLGGAVPAPPDLADALADLLDLPLAGEVAAGEVAEPPGGGRPAPVPDAVRDVLPEAPPTWCEHDALLVDGFEVEWWVTGPVVHASTVGGLARGLAWSAGAWGRRLHVAEALLDPDGAAALLVDDAFEAGFRTDQSGA